MNEIPLSAPDITESEIEAVAAVLRTGRLSLGPQLQAFENAMAACLGAPHAIGVSSGTAGLHLTLLANNIGPGDEVIVPSFTFIAVANAVRYTGAHPVFADIDPNTLNLDPASVEAALTPRTRVLIAVHTFGRPADLPVLLAIAQRHNLLLIEDGCEAIGARINGQPVGSFGDCAVFAFYPNKQITTGEGGMVLTRHPEIARRIRALRNHGRYESAAPQSWLDHAEVGFNYRLSEMQAALGLAQLARLNEILTRRESIARRYNERLAETPHLHLPTLDVPGQRLSWFVFVVRLAEECTRDDRDRVMRALAAEGIATGRYFAPIHQQPAYAEHPTAPLPVTESIAARTLALPFFNRITEDQMQRVTRTLRTALHSALAHK
ncbi:MAG: DegT/DnrJ/EryC1/StrS family aminotransferase [Acidobacteriaceae bacterium]